MTRPRRSTIYVKKRAVMVERKSARPTKWQTHKKVAAWKAAQNEAKTVSQSSTRSEDRVQDASIESPKISEPLDRPILAEVERCLSHRPMQFPQKLWGEVL